MPKPLQAKYRCFACVQINTLLNEFCSRNNVGIVRVPLPGALTAVYITKDALKIIAVNSRSKDFVWMQTAFELVNLPAPAPHNGHCDCLN